MRTLFTSNEIEVLSLEGLNYTTNFSSVIEKSSHVPIFSKKQQLYYVHMGEEIRGFVINKTQYGFRYYNDNGELSPYWTAIFCQLEGEESECVILGRYYQNEDADFMDSCWELPYGCYRPRTSCPRVFYSSKEDFMDMRSYTPKLYKVNEKFVAYKYDVQEHKAVSAPIQIDAYYRTASGDLHVVKNAIDGKVWFDDERTCIISHRKNMIAGE